MTGLFTSIVRAPITGIVLIAEMCRSLSISLCAFMGHVVANTLKCKPIYHSLLEDLLRIKKDNQLEDKTILHYSLELGLICIDRMIKDIGLRKQGLIIDIQRDTVLRLGDELNRSDKRCLT